MRNDASQWILSFAFFFLSLPIPLFLFCRIPMCSYSFLNHFSFLSDNGFIELENHCTKKSRETKRRFFFSWAPLSTYSLTKLPMSFLSLPNSVLPPLDQDERKGEELLRKVGDLEKEKRELSERLAHTESLLLSAQRSLFPRPPPLSTHTHFSLSLFASLFLPLFFASYFSSLFLSVIYLFWVVLLCAHYVFQMPKKRMKPNMWRSWRKRKRRLRTYSK